MASDDEPPTAGEDAEDDLSSSAGALFTEPAGYFKPEKQPTEAEYTLRDGRVLRLGLVGESPLWGHILWNSSQATAAYLQNNAARLVRGKDVLELGAGAGLPGIVCGIEGARRVVITDYPDAPLVDNIRRNIERHRSWFREKSEVFAEGYLWGSPAPSAFHARQCNSSSTNGISNVHSSTSSASRSDSAETEDPQFDLFILSDLLFNHSEHPKLLQTVRKFLRKLGASSSAAKALITFTPHRPHLLDKDMAFFELVRAEGDMKVEKVLDVDMGRPMFANDPGDEGVRRRVLGWEISWV